MEPMLIPAFLAMILMFAAIKPLAENSVMAASMMRFCFPRIFFQTHP